MQSLWASYVWEAAGLPSSGGVPTLRPNTEKGRQRMRLRSIDTFEAGLRLRLFSRMLRDRTWGASTR
jgi:hypothetical protein